MEFADSILEADPNHKVKRYPAYDPSQDNQKYWLPRVGRPVEKNLVKLD